MELPAVWLTLFNQPMRVDPEVKKEGMESLESRLQFTLGQRRLTLEAEHEPISAILDSY
ncbi:conserved hypothetical protein [Ricinus communis]|uniref:Uncharacterized protein n=1 Tax=Ricinus communis TaxID=3988 RepID=B9STB6_RICCO|nr:conserved hypothetical protein [Ricinus communis]EEF33148.1 conserved hypothetical protein [Ricinus communis]